MLKNVVNSQTSLQIVFIALDAIIERTRQYHAVIHFLPSKVKFD